MPSTKMVSVIWAIDINMLFIIILFLTWDKFYVMFVCDAVYIKDFQNLLKIIFYSYSSSYHYMSAYYYLMNQNFIQQEKRSKGLNKRHLDRFCQAMKMAEIWARREMPNANVGR